MRPIARLMVMFGVVLLLLFNSDARLTAGKGKPKSIPIRIDEKAPAFEAVDEQGKAWKSSDYVGKKKYVVVFFYPEGFVGGVEKQTAGFRDKLDFFKDNDVEIVGISGDSAKTNTVFKKKMKLPYTLLSDEKGEAAKKFGLTVKAGAKTAGMDADKKKYEADRRETIEGWTFVIDKKGIVVDSVGSSKFPEISPGIVMDAIKGLEKK